MSTRTRLLHVCLGLAALYPAVPAASLAAAPAPPDTTVPRPLVQTDRPSGPLARPADPLPGIGASEPISETNRLIVPTATRPAAAPVQPVNAPIMPTARSDESVAPTATRPPATATATPRPLPPTATPPKFIVPVPIATAPVSVAPTNPDAAPIVPVPIATAPSIPQPIVPQPIAGSPVPGVLQTPNAVRPPAGGSSIGPLGAETTGKATAGSPTPSTGRSLRDQEPEVAAMLTSPTPEPTRTPTPLPPTPTRVPPTVTVAASPSVTVTRTLTATRAVASTTPTPDTEDLATWEETISLVSIAPSALTLPPVSDGPTFVLAVPYRSQLDGTAYERANCGPASLSMVLDAFGVKVPTSRVRNQSNQLQGTYGYDDGIALDYLAQIGDQNGLESVGLYGKGGGSVFYNYKYWTVDEIREQVLAGRPVITLARYQALPGNSWSRYSGDHYIVITGLFGRNFVYNDAAFVGSYGYARLMSEQTLLKVWNTSSIPHHAVAFAPGKQSSLKTVDINQSESARAALLAVAASGEEALELPATAPTATAGLIGFGDGGQLQVYRRNLGGLALEEGERVWGSLGGLAGLLEANAPTEMRHLAPTVRVAQPAPAAVAAPAAVEPAETPAAEAVAEAEPATDVTSTEAAAEAPAEAARPAGNPIQAFLSGVVQWFQSLTASIPILSARSS